MSGAEFAGSLRDRITVERVSAQRDALGAASDETSIIGTFWAAVETDGTGSVSDAESRSAPQRWRFTLRQTGEVMPGDRIIWGARKLTILTAAADLRLLPKTILTAEETR